jgi:hypothetical protein
MVYTATSFTECGIDKYFYVIANDLTKDHGINLKNLLDNNYNDNYKDKMSQLQSMQKLCIRSRSEISEFSKNSLRSLIPLRGKISLEESSDTLHEHVKKHIYIDPLYYGDGLSNNDKSTIEDIINDIIDNFIKMANTQGVNFCQSMGELTIIISKDNNYYTVLSVIIKIVPETRFLFFKSKTNYELSVNKLCISGVQLLNN